MNLAPNNANCSVSPLKRIVWLLSLLMFLKAEWDDINEVVRSLGGKWVKGDIISYWEIPLQ